MTMAIVLNRVSDWTGYNRGSYHMGRFESPDELAGLLVVRVGREGDVVHRHLELQLLA